MSNDPSAIVQDLEKADVKAAQNAAEHRHQPLVRTLGTLSEIADQVPLAVVCSAVLAGGLIAERRDVARTGARMLAAHVLANVAKRRIKNRLRRTRPVKVVEEDRYVFEPGKSREGNETSFPSGHTAGAIAVARVVAGDLPRLALPAAGIAILISAVQIPRGKHYPLDVSAGAALGFVSAWVVDWIFPDQRR